MIKRFTTLNFVFTALFAVFFGHLKAQSSQSSTIIFSSDQQSWVYGSAVNNGNHLVSVGYFQASGYVQKPAQGYSGTDSFDAFIICTDEKGNVIWKKTFGSQNSTWCMNVACDNNGNSFVSGYFENSFVLDGVTFSSLGKYNDFLMKLDSTGKVIWSITYAVPFSYFENNEITPMTCDADGNIYYILSFINSVKINNQTFSNNGGHSSMLIKFDNSGNLIWGKTMLGKATFSAITTDNSGHVYIGGVVGTGKTTWGGANLPGAADTVSDGLFMAKLDAGTGDMQWVKRCTGTGSYSEITYLSVSKNGTVYAGGFFGDTLSIDGKNYYATAHMYNGYQDGMVMNFDTSGKIIWLKNYGNYEEPEYPAGFCMDQNDNVYIGGTFDVPITLGSKTLFSTRARDSYIIRFDRYGNYKQSVASKEIVLENFTTIEGLMSDADNNLFMYGGFQGQVNFGGDTLSSPGQLVGFIWETTPSFTAGIGHEALQTVDGFSLYPNPVSGNEINLEIDDSKLRGNLEISCIDMAGKLMFHETTGHDNDGINNYTIQLPCLIPGVYFMRIISSEGISVQKFIRN